MGVDIHICAEYREDGKWKSAELFDLNGKRREILEGRNYDLFNYMQGEDSEYEAFSTCGIPDDICEFTKEVYEKDKEWCWGFNYAYASDIFNWHNKHPLYKQAGYVSKYEAWEYAQKGRIPDYIKTEKDSEDDVWIEFEDYSQDPVYTLKTMILARMSAFWVWEDTDFRIIYWFDN